MEHHDQVLQFALSPLNAWESTARTMPQDMRERIARHAVSLAQELVRAAAYLDSYGPEGHGRAVKRTNAKVTRVRKALGFAYPKVDITF